LPYMLWNSDIKSAVHNYSGYNVWDYEVPLVRYYGKRGAIKHVLRDLVIPESNKPERVMGYQGQQLPWTSDFDDAVGKIGKFSVVIDSATLTLFREYLTACKADKIPIIFVYSPEYIEGQNFVQNRQQIMQLYNDLSKEFQIPFFDYSNSSLSYQKQYFYNAEHLNKTGAERFTHQLIDSIKKYDLTPKG